MTREEAHRTDPAARDGVVQSRYRGALMGVAVGDAIGAAFEGSPGPIPLNRLRVHLNGSTPASYTDDTAMTIAVCESVLHADGLDQDHLAGTFSARYEREPGRGYGAGTAGLLREIARGGAWRTLAPAQFGGTGSYGNGTAMRAAPFGLWATDHQSAAELARRAARITHSHPHAVDAAGVQAAAVASAIDMTDDGQGSVDHFVAAIQSVTATAEMRDRLDQAVVLRTATGAEVARRVGTSVAALEAVPAAISSFLHHLNSFADAVTFAIGLGGDTDTIASMTAAMSGARLGVQAIPISWLERCEGTDLMQELADRLFIRRHGR